MNASTKGSKAPGNFDESFGTRGIVHIQLPSESFYGTSRLLPDGKILSVGSIQSSDMLVIVRHTADGILDETFGSQGVVHTRLPEVHSVTLLNFTVQSNGKIIVFAGLGEGLDPFSAALFARLLPDGRLDLIFGTNGMTSFNIQLDANRRRTGIAVQQDGKIFVAAETSHETGRGGVIFGLSANGQPDMTFGNNGLVFSMGDATFQSLTLQGDKILVGGIYQKGGLIARYTDKGELDLSYGGFNQGFVLIDGTGATHVEIIHLSQLPDGKTLAAGYIFKGSMTSLKGTRPLLSRVTPNGKEDDTFNGGKALEILVTDDELDYGWLALYAAVQADEKIIVLCQILSTTTSALLRYTKNGTRDTDFETHVLQLFDSQPNAVVQVQPDEKILMSGSNDGTGVIARFLS